MATQHTALVRCNHCMTVMTEECADKEFACIRCGKDDALMEGFIPSAIVSGGALDLVEARYRWNAFEPGGAVEELRGIIETLLSRYGWPEKYTPKAREEIVLKARAALEGETE